MPILNIFLVLTVVVIWGLNFLFVSYGLLEVSPLMLCAFRFILASIPGIFFIKRPSPFKYVALYGLIMFALQFSLMFMGMNAGMSPGMASLIAQVQVFFSMFFSAVLLREKPHSWQILGALISFMGIGIVALHTNNSMSLPGLVLIIAATATWGFGNVITKKARNINFMSLVVWGSFVASFPMVLLTLVFDGPSNILTHFQNLTSLGTLSILYIVYCSTWMGYGIWNWLLSQHPISTVAPFTLLVPIIAVLSSVIFLHEAFEPWKIAAGLLVILGLVINLLGPRLLKYRRVLNTS